MAQRPFRGKGGKAPSSSYPYKINLGARVSMPIYYSMGLVLSLMICGGLVLELVVPAIARARQLGKMREQEQFYLTKLRIVRRYYPTLSELTYSEIVERYDVEALYENLGRSVAATAR